MTVISTDAHIQRFFSTCMSILFFKNSPVSSSTLAWNKLKCCRYDCTPNFVSMFCHSSTSSKMLSFWYIFSPSGYLSLHSASACPFVSSLSSSHFSVSHPLLFIFLHNSFFFFFPLWKYMPFSHLTPSPSPSLSLSQGLSRCHMTNGTTISRPGYVMQWLSLPRRPPP